jgi:trigger factor
MQVSIENIDDCKRKVVIQIPAEEITQKENERIKELKKAGPTLKGGFRAGKAPIDVVLQQLFGGKRQFRSSVVHGLLKDKFFKAVDEHGIELSESPTLDDVTDSGEGAVTFTTICEVFPNFELNDFASLKLSKIELALTDAEYNEQLDKLLVQHGDLVYATDANYQAVLNDQITATVLLWPNKDAQAELSEDDAMQHSDIVIDLQENGRFGFEIDLLGMKAGESKNIIGRDSSPMKVTVEAIKTLVKAQPDDKLAEKLNIHCAHDIRGYIEGKLQEYTYDRSIKKTRTQLLDQLASEYSKLPLPQTVLERYKVAINKGEGNAANIGPSELSLEEQAHRAAVLDLLRDKIVKKFDLKINEERVVSLIMKLAMSTFNDYNLVLELYSKNPVLLNQVRTFVLDEQITELALQEAQVQIEKLSLLEMDNLDKTAS